MNEMVKILRGDGSAGSPFILFTPSYILSTGAQNEILDGLFGQGKWKPVARKYSFTPTGLPGNQDFLEYQVKVGASLKKVCFDLSLVTKLAHDPNFSPISKMETKIFQEVRDHAVNDSERMEENDPILQITIDHSPSDMEPIEELASRLG